MVITNEILRFVDFWENHGDEKNDTQLFWLQLLRDVLSIERPEELITFEKASALNIRVLLMLMCLQHEH